MDAERKEDAIPSGIAAVPSPASFRSATAEESEINVVTQWLAKVQHGPSDPVDATTALEELHSSYEELRVAEEELIAQNHSLEEVQAVLQEERFRYQELFELAPDGYILTDLNGVIREANLAALQMLQIESRF